MMGVHAQEDMVKTLVEEGKEEVPSDEEEEGYCEDLEDEEEIFEEEYEEVEEEVEVEVEEEVEEEEEEIEEEVEVGVQDGEDEHEVEGPCEEEEDEEVEVCLPEGEVEHEVEGPCDEGAKGAHSEEEIEEEFMEEASEEEFDEEAAEAEIEGDIEGEQCEDEEELVEEEIEEDVEESEDDDVVLVALERGGLVEKAYVMEDGEEVVEKEEEVDEVEEEVVDQPGIFPDTKDKDALTTPLSGRGHVEEAGEMKDEEEVEEVEEEGEEVEEIEVEEEEIVEELTDEEEVEEEGQEVADEIDVASGKNLTVGARNVVVSKKKNDKSNEEIELSENEIPPCFDKKELGSAKSSSNEKKRTADTMLTPSGKKIRKDMFGRTGLSAGSTSSGRQDKSGETSEVCETTGSSGKRRRSRWDMQPEDEKMGGEGGTEVIKRKRTRWASDDAELKIIGPLQLPDFTRGLDAEKVKSLVLKELNEELLEINQKLLNPEISHVARSELVDKKQRIVSKLVKEISAFQSPPKDKPLKLYRKLYIPSKEFPNYNFIGLIIGPRGKNQKKLEAETGARIVLRGKGSIRESEYLKRKKNPEPSDNEDLHVLIEADNENSLDAAVSMVEKLLIPMNGDKLKVEQLRELAVMNNTLHPKDFCQICEGVHSTRFCPLTARSPASDSQPSNSHTQIADGFFSSFSAKLEPDIQPSGVGYNVSKVGQQVDEANLYVAYLPQNIDEAALAQLFSPFGTIKSVKVARDPASGISKCYGFVKYTSPASAAVAIQQMHQFPIGGKMLTVRVAGHPQAGTLNANTPMQVPVGQPSSQVGSPAILRVSPCWPNAPAMVMHPVSCMTYPQNSNILANNGSFIPCPSPCGLPFNTPVLPTPGTIPTVELDSFAGNPDKSATSLFSGFSKKNTPAVLFEDHKVPFTHRMAMSNFSPSPVRVIHVPPIETAIFPGNFEHPKTWY